tara:strand:- start:1313 stop:1816 length:504 start_codon:yes stop_codon:yes gene_type:complete
VIGALTALLGGMIIPALPDDCNLPGWTFCVMLPDDASVRIETNGPDFIVYAFEAEDGSVLRVYVGNAPSVQADEGWQWGRLGQGQTRWLASEGGRTDYLMDRNWADPVPNWLHVWTLPSDDGEIDGAEALVNSLQSCMVTICPDPGPNPVAIPERIERPDWPLPMRH